MTHVLEGRPRVAVVGAGAIGGWIAVRLARAGCAVSVLARGATLAALRQHGLQLTEGPPEAPLTHTAALRADTDAAALGPQDLVVLAVKTPALAQVAPAVQVLLTADTVVLTAMNGVPWWFFDGFGAALAGTRLATVDPDGAIARAIPAGHVIGAVVHASCAATGPARVRHQFGRGLVVGEPAGGRSPRLAALAALLARAGFEATVSDCIQRDVWFKLWGNMTINPVCALTGATADRVLDDELVRGFIDTAMLEARAIGARLGLAIDQTPQDRHAVTRRLGRLRPSMLQDVDAGRPVELDALVGAVRELGQRTGVPTPALDALFGLARLHARTRGLY